MIKKATAVFLLVATILSICSLSASAAENLNSLATAGAVLSIVEETYSAYAKCEFYAATHYTYHTIKATVRLYQDDADYAVWTYNNTSCIDEIETYPVTQGHDYFLGIHIKVYDQYGNLVDEVIEYTNIISYY